MIIDFSSATDWIPATKAKHRVSRHPSWRNSRRPDDTRGDIHVVHGHLWTLSRRLLAWPGEGGWYAASETPGPGIKRNTEAIVGPHATALQAVAALVKLLPQEERDCRRYEWPRDSGNYLCR